MGHTKGWGLAQDGVAIVDSEGRQIALMDWYADGLSIESARRDARLIAAAPDLLEALQQVDYFGAALIAGEFRVSSPTVVAMVKAARAAIAKAKGTQ